MSSFKTTVLGIVTILAAIAGFVRALVDDDPSTLPNWEATVAAIIAGIGLIMARDNNVTSEAAGVK